MGFRVLQIALGEKADCENIVLKMFGGKLVLLAVIIALAAAEYQIDPTQGRIIQGKNAIRGQFPFYVFLEVRLPHAIAACGGSLISKQWFLRPQNQRILIIIQ